MIKNICAFLVTFLLAMGGFLTAQELDKDLQLLCSHEYYPHERNNQIHNHSHIHNHEVTFGVSRKNSFVAKYNPVSLAFSCLLYSYQKWLSPQISSNCYYEPTCSRYSKLLFQEYGLVKGLFTSADRLMRCDRISATTFHPVSINPKDHKVHEDVNRYSFKEDKEKKKR